MKNEFSAPLYRFDHLDSTNVRAKEFALKGAPEGTVVLALQQTAGRGRGTHQWHSPLGGLYFSVILYPKEGRHITEISILAGTALAQATRAVLPKQLDISVKWPNDLLINWKKAAGVLCEAISSHGQTALIVGMGLNVNVPKIELAAFNGNPFPATSIMEEVGHEPFDLDEILSVILKKFFTLYELYKKEGFAPIQYLWEKNCQMVGKRIELREVGWREPKTIPDADNNRGVTVGTFLGIDEGGALVLANAKGERHQYVTGEISCFWL